MKNGKATKGYTTLRELTPQQLQAVDLVMEGKKDDDVASAVGVHRVTVTKWRTRHPAFVAEVGRRKLALRAASSARLSRLLSTALDRIERELVDGPQGGKLAMRIVEATGLLDPREFDDASPVTPDGVVDKLTREAMPDPFDELADMLSKPNPGSIEATWDELDDEFKSPAKP